MKTRFYIAGLAFAMSGTFPVAAAPPATVASAPAYVIQADDVLDISVAGEPEMTRSVTVLPDGTITYPYAGEIVAAGLTTAQVRRRLTAKVSRQLAAPEIVVSVSHRAERDASVLGAVKTPGKFAIGPGWRLLDLLAQTGGLLSARPEWASAVLARRVGAATPVNLLRLITLAAPADNVLVAKGDILIVREIDQAKTQVQVLGEVVRPGTFPIPSDGSVAATLAAAGGPTAAAALTRAAVLRGADTIPLNLQSLMRGGNPVGTVVLQPGDTLIVPTNRLTFAVFGAVARPGAVAYPEDRKLDYLSALSLAGGQERDADLRKAVLLRPSPTGGKPAVIEVNLWDVMRRGDMARNVAVEPGDVLFLPGKGGDSRLTTRDFLGLASPLLFLLR